MKGWWGAMVRWMVFMIAAVSIMVSIGHEVGVCSSVVMGR